MVTALVVDDDRSLHLIVQSSLEAIGIQVISSASAEDGLRVVGQQRPDVVLLDVMLPGRSGLDVLQDILAIDRRIPVIIVTADSGSSTAIEAMRRGAYDYVSKPFHLSQLQQLVQTAARACRKMHESVAIAADPEVSNGERSFIGRSPRMIDVFKAIGRVASQDVPVLIRGESGTGKELVAQAIYQHSRRREHSYMEINCAALPDSLLESELFGHEKGAFTGADRRRIGKFEQCHGGTLFLDEVGDMSPSVQGKVLRLIQEQRFERIGGNETISTNVRIITATNLPLEEMVEKKTFRADLLFRLNGMTIHLPPLREREGDIPLLLRYFLARSQRAMGKPHLEGMSPECLDVLQNYRWPGNVRELQSVVQQAVLNATGPIIIPEFLPPELLAGAKGQSDQQARSLESAASNLESGATPAAANSKNLPTGTPGDVSINELGAYIEERLLAKSTDLAAETIERVERYLFARVLEYTGGNQSQAAEILGVTRGKIRDRVEQFKISILRNIKPE